MLSAKAFITVATRPARSGTRRTRRTPRTCFTRHFVLPGTLLVQILTSNGRQLPPIGFDHLLLSLGLAGSYGGQTSVTGVNVRTHIAGIFAARLEAPTSSPYELLRALTRIIHEKGTGSVSVEELASAVTRAMSGHYRTHVGTEDACDYQRQLVAAFERDDSELRKRYEDAAQKIGDLFEQHFTPRKA